MVPDDTNWRILSAVDLPMPLIAISSDFDSAVTSRPEPWIPEMAFS